MKRLSGLFFLFVLVVTISACARTGHRTDVEAPKPGTPQSGFLGAEYYAKMTPGDEDKYEAALRWISPDHDLRNYDKLMLDPIVVYRGEKGKAEGIAAEDAQQVADYFYNALYTALQDDIQMVNKPGPKTLRFSVALTDLEDRNVTLDTISSLHPGSKLVSHGVGWVSDKPAFTGAAVIEAMARDAQTGKVLGVAIDKRVGGKTIAKGFSDWTDVLNACDYWAMQTKYRLCLRQGRAGCEPPKAGPLD